MAKLYFHYAAMNAGKSTILLQAAYNYQERGMRTLLLKPAIDTRGDAPGSISSRIGIAAPATLFRTTDDLFAMIEQENAAAGLDCVLLDEAQFLTKEQAWALARVADILAIPVMCYGLRTDFQGELFPGSAALLAIADNLREIRTICWCGRKASMVLRIDEKGHPIKTGEQIEIGDDQRYVSLCRKHWCEGETGRAS
ncbi:MAG: thymidine kinase [Parvularcula sp.]